RARTCARWSPALRFAFFGLSAGKETNAGQRSIYQAYGSRRGHKLGEQRAAIGKARGTKAQITTRDEAGRITPGVAKVAKPGQDAPSAKELGIPHKRLQRAEKLFEMGEELNRGPGLMLAALAAGPVRNRKLNPDLGAVNYRRSEIIIE